jgi:hypothetical protein
MKGKLLFRYQGLQGGFIVQMILWRLPVVIAERPHGLKYRLYCGRGSECIVRYDNETGKVITAITAITKNHMTLNHWIN